MPSDSFKHHHSSMLSLNNAFYYGQSRLSKDRRKTRPFFILGDMHYLAFIRQAQQSSIVYRSNANIHILSTNTPPKHPLHNNNNPHPPPNSPTNPQTQLPKQKAPVAKHTTKTCHHHGLEQLLHLRSDRDLHPADSLPASQLPKAGHQPGPKAELQAGQQKSPLRQQHLGLGTFWATSPVAGHCSLLDEDR
jgi:hypothetical protein